MNNNKLDTRHGQTTWTRTYQFCALLKFGENNVRYLIETLHSTLFKTHKPIASDDTTKPQAKKTMTAYTHENIEKNLSQYDPLPRFNRDHIIAANVLYRDTLKAIFKFFENNQTTKYDCFCLFYFMGSLFSHLPKLSHLAGENYWKALGFLSACSQEKEYQEINAAQIINKIQQRLVKHEALPFNLNLNPIRYFPISMIGALTAKTYICRRLCRVIHPISLLLPQTQSIVCVKDINTPRILGNISTTRFSKLVLKLNALDSIYHSRFKIIFSETVDPSNGGATGIYNNRNTIRINPNEVFLESVLFHELTHRAMDRVFSNLCCPYFRSNHTAKMAYRKSIKKVIINFINFISPELKINNWTLNQLVKKYFSSESTFMNCHSESRSELHVWHLYTRLQTIFTVYSISSLDSEFITNVAQFINEVDKSSKYLEIIQPLMDFIDLHVIPAMEEYIDEHPCRGRITDV